MVAASTYAQAAQEPYVWTEHYVRETKYVPSTAIMMPLSLGDKSERCDYCVIPSSSVAASMEEQISLYIQINNAYLQKCSEPRLMKNVFLQMVNVACSLPIKAINFDYSEATKTLVLHLLLVNDIRISLTKSVENEGDDLIAYSIQYLKQTLLIDIAELLVMR